MSGRLDNEELRSRLLQRRAALQERAEHIASDLRRESDPSSSDAPDRAIQRENDEVLESLGKAARGEISRIDEALRRIGKPGGLLCRACGRPIEPERLIAVPDTNTCAVCAVGKPHGEAQNV